MKDYNRFSEAKFHILEEAEKKLNRQKFCEFHGISEPKLSRILSGKQEITFEMLDYIAQELSINTTIYIN